MSDVGGREAEIEAEAAARALMKRWIDQANAERYEGGPHTSPMVEPEEYDVDDPPEGMWEQALGDAEVAIAALDAVRSSGSAQTRDWRCEWNEVASTGSIGQMTMVGDALVDEVDRLRSSGSAAQNQEEARRAAHNAAQNWVDAAGGDEVDTGHVVDAALDAYRFRLRSSGSAAQNQEERVYDCAYNNARYAEPCDRCPAARSPQDEDHEPDERALDTPLGARQRAQTQRDVADILRFGAPQRDTEKEGA